MTQYRFLTTWLLETSREAVFEAIKDSRRWPEWWPGVKQATQLEPGENGGVGSLNRFTWKSKLPYELTFNMRTIAIDSPFYIEGKAEGDLEGTGRWWIFSEQSMTAAVYSWNVKTTERWMNLVAPIGQPVFKWNHDYVMRRGGEGLARLLNARLVANS